ncbi:isochorismatase family protein [Candidatus Falkowbacteria bacterium]|jgi:nicotinamidase/pyrazinamidase|nr:isochorismatase family protein [Candidatus Falkowbacteria bacterium]MBT6227280.1 isochorismatase family protein [Candidatus Scalindua sp.]MBT6574424.1 isochorismatase family protein [Candidatus Falkowbacteria bacterium]MBT7348966.1 isochorismatase family protein [Candidatus Falkowbacteria bacterium]MBT7500307.1 isochorismatase family protein [Candidatus Falkowbacteria bacterium]
MKTIRKIKIGRILIIVDPQLDFMESGALAVTGGSALMKMINALMATGEYDLIIVTQDWHPEGHYEFASRHGVAPFAMVKRNGVEQMVFFDHCKQNSSGAMIHPLLDMSKVALIVRKGMDPDVASHSAFFSGVNENGERITTGLAESLSAYDFEGIDVVCLAFDVCVKDSAKDAKMEFPEAEVRVLKEYCASVFPENDEQIIQELEAAEVVVVR